MKEKKFGLVFEDHLPELLPLHYARLEIDKASVIKKVLPITSNPLLDTLFDSLAV